MKKRLEPNRLPCDQTLVAMGGSWSPPPTEWVTREQTCRCGTRFTVTASEQRFWYEQLRIPIVVSIDRCPACRKRQRAHRRIMTSLSELLPRIERGEAREDELRDAALAIAEGIVRTAPSSGRTKERILDGARIAEKGAALVATLRRRSQRHDDLIPLQIRFHERLRNARKLWRLRTELAVMRSRRGPTERSLRTVESWLSSPTKALRERIAEPPRR